MYLMASEVLLVCPRVLKDLQTVNAEKVASVLMPCAKVTVHIRVE